MQTIFLDDSSRVVNHADKIGNGASVKTGIRNAKCRLLLMMDGDG
jgi:hypothetical protein